MRAVGACSRENSAVTQSTTYPSDRVAQLLAHSPLNLARAQRFVLEGVDPFDDETIDPAAIKGVVFIAARIARDASEVDFAAEPVDDLRTGLVAAVMTGYAFARLALGTARRALRYTSDKEGEDDAASQLLSAFPEFDFADLIRHATPEVEEAIVGMPLEEAKEHFLRDRHSSLRLFGRQCGFRLGVAEEELFGVGVPEVRADTPEENQSDESDELAEIASATLDALHVMIQQFDRVRGERARTPAEVRAVAARGLKVLKSIEELLPFPEPVANRHLEAGLRSLTTAEKIAATTRATLFGRARTTDIRAAMSSMQEGFDELRLAMWELTVLARGGE